MKLSAAGRMTCDFCENPRVFRLLKTRNRTAIFAGPGGSLIVIELKPDDDVEYLKSLAGAHVDVDGKWVACVDCTALVLDRNARELAKRVSTAVVTPIFKIRQKRARMLGVYLLALIKRFEIILDGLEPEMEEIKP